MKITAVSHTFPTVHNPAQGKIIKDELDLIQDHVELELIIPAVKAPSFLQQSKRAQNHIVADYPLITAPYFSFPKRLFPDFIQKQISKSILEAIPVKTDIVHLQWLFPNGLAAAELKRKGFRVIQSIHGSDWGLTNVDPKLQPYIKEMLGVVDQIIVVGNKLKEDISLHYPQFRSKIQVVHHGINTELFKPKQHPKKRSGDDKFELLTVANLFPVKGIDVLIKALSDLKATILNKIELTIISAASDSDYKKEILKQIDNLGLQDRVSFIEKLPQEELVGHYQQGDLFILPSRSEAFGLALAEAAACGLPSVATKSGGPEEIIGFAEMGILINPDAPNEMTNAIERVLSNLKQYNPSKIRNHIVSNFSKESKLEKILSIYEQVLEC